MNKKSRTFYIMIQSGLMEYEGRSYYQVRIDRPWTDEELWGFEQVILTEGNNDE